VKVRTPVRALIALAVVVALPAAALGARVAPIGGYTVVCCCGPHDPLNDCGCPECPAAPRSVLADAGPGPAHDGQSIAPCQRRADQVQSPAQLHWGLPPAPVMLPGRTPMLPSGPPPALQARVADPPPTPPPR
jgi:hypothetical protein